MSNLTINNAIGGLSRGSTINVTAAQGVLATDTDPFGSSLAVSAVSTNSQTTSISGGSATLQGAYGTLTMHADGSYSYASLTNLSLPADGILQDSFAFSVADGLGNTGQAALTITITQVGVTYIAAAAGQTINLGNSATVVDASLGNVTVNGGNANYVVIGGANDKITLGNGNDWILGGANETITVGNGNDVISVGANSSVKAGNGTDSITAGANSTVIAGNGNDTITVGDGSSVKAGNGADTITAGSNATITAGNGADTITAGAGSTVTQKGSLVATITSIVAAGAGITNGNGDLNAGKTVALTVNFDKSVVVNTSGGSPVLLLNDGGTATYSGGSGTAALVFTYTVAAGQKTTH